MQEQEYQHEQQALPGKIRVQLPPGQQDQRNVDQQRQIADADVKHVLDDGGQAVDAGGGKGIWKDEQLIAQPHAACGGRYGQITAQGDIFAHGATSSLFQIPLRSIQRAEGKCKRPCKNIPKIAGNFS